MVRYSVKVHRSKSSSDCVAEHSVRAKAFIDGVVGGDDDPLGPLEWERGAFDLHLEWVPVCPDFEMVTNEFP